MNPAFLVYLIFLMSVGIYFYFKNSNGVGAWVTALSAQAPDVSSWLFLGLPGAVYLFGGNQMWIAIGLIIGQPHFAHFMSVSSLKELSKAQNIAMIWVVILLFGSVAVGLTGMGLFQNINQFRGDPELVFIMSLQKLFNPRLQGILLPAILSAIKSTIDSQLLVSSTTRMEDFYRLIRKNTTEIKAKRFFSV